MLSSFMLNILSGKAVQAFCWMLAHSLWQGLVFAILVGIVLMTTTRSSATVRYNLIATLFFFFLATCGITFFVELASAATPAARLGATASAIGEPSPLRRLFQSVLKYYAAHTGWVLLAWFAIFCWKAVQLTGAIAYNHRLKGGKLPIADAGWRSRFNELVRGMDIQKEVSFFESAIIKIPVVIGHLKPVIFLPVGVLTHLSPAEVEAVLLHELAHIKRNDYLVNLCQLAAETVFAFNPALRWISAILREEREACCDDLAIAATRSKRGFIQALVSFREHAAITTPYRLAFPASGNGLLKRVSRIVHNRNGSLDGRGKGFVLVSLLLLGVLVKGATDTLTIAAPVGVAKRREILALVADQPNPNARAFQQVEVSVIAPAKASKRERVAQITRQEAKAAPKQVDVALLPSGPNKIVSSITPAEGIGETTPRGEAERYRMQAERDRMVAMADRAQAALDRVQVEADRAQAIRDREQAQKDRAQAIKDRAQAEKDRQQVQRERAWVDRDGVFHQRGRSIEI